MKNDRAPGEFKIHLTRGNFHHALPLLARDTLHTIEHRLVKWYGRAEQYVPAAQTINHRVDPYLLGVPQNVAGFRVYPDFLPGLPGDDIEGVAWAAVFPLLHLLIRNSPGCALRSITRACSRLIVAFAASF
ncbi:hypothetical protein [Polaromonas sp. UBA4122]|uniref:hypothetical protein n=1 Tax=Polaromonas sp. UBA4122 TaxID=1947074 RepID=UPI0025F9F59A|nr:hypothetical protein [Polaromonas sp. UBA4122]